MNFEEFRGNIQLKNKVLQESLQNTQHRINTCELRIKDQHAYLLRLKKKIAEVQSQSLPLHRLEHLEHKLTDDYLENLVQLKTNLALADKIAQIEKFGQLEIQVKDLNSRINIVEKSEIGRSQTVAQ